MLIKKKMNTAWIASLNFKSRNNNISYGDEVPNCGQQPESKRREESVRDRIVWQR